MVLFVAGVGGASTKLGAFHNALTSAGIEKCNLIPVSSILSKRWGKIYYSPKYEVPAGTIIAVIRSQIEFAPEPHNHIIAGLGVVEKSDHRVVFEAHASLGDLPPLTAIAELVKHEFRKQAQPFGELAEYYWIFMEASADTFYVGANDNCFEKKVFVTEPDLVRTAFVAFVVRRLKCEAGL